jgi:hypothetical protein
MLVVGFFYIRIVQNLSMVHMCVRVFLHKIKFYLSEGVLTQNIMIACSFDM